MTGAEGISPVGEIVAQAIAVIPEIGEDAGMIVMVIVAVNVGADREVTRKSLEISTDPLLEVKIICKFEDVESKG